MTIKPLALAVALICTAVAPSALAQSEPVVRAVASVADDGVVLRYALPRPTTEVAFADKGAPRGRWSVTTPGLTLTDGVISGPTPFQSFELKLLPDAEELDRTYISLTRAGEGRVLYGPALMIEGVRTDLSFDLTPGQAALPLQNSIGGYAYVGPSEAIEAGPAADVVVGANVPADLAAPARRAFFDALAFYERELGRGLPFRPAVIVSVDSPGPATFRGDVTDTGVISVRFYGDLWRESADDVPPFLWHEAFHLWNGHAVIARDADEAPWLHEGAADYAALIGAVTSGDLSEDQARERLMRRVNGCRSVLGARPLDPSRLRSGGAPYDCGVLFQWLADLDLRAKGSDILDLWRDLLATGADNAGYGVADFRARLPADSAVLRLLDRPGEGRWADVRRRLSERGVTLINRPGDRDLRNAALFHVLSQACTGGYGFSRAAEGLILDEGSCGALSGAPTVVRVEGADLSSDGRVVFDAIKARCDAGQPVRVSTLDRRDLETPCARPLTEPEVWSIAQAPSLAVDTP